VRTPRTWRRTSRLRGGWHCGEAVSGYDDTHASGASAETFLFKRIRGSIADAAYAERKPGADADAMKVFMHCLREARATRTRQSDCAAHSQQGSQAGGRPR